MKAFKDNQGREWEVDLNCTTVKRLRTMLDIDIGDALDGKLLAKLASNPMTVCDVVYVICKPQCDKLSVSDEDFGRAMRGDSILHARDAFIQELPGFFMSPVDRENMQRIVDATMRLDKTRTELVRDELATGGMEEAAIAEMKLRLTQARDGLKDSSGAAPASAA